MGQFKLFKLCALKRFFLVVFSLFMLKISRKKLKHFSAFEKFECSWFYILNEKIILSKVIFTLSNLTQGHNSGVMSLVLFC